jgi:hypothetical protein
MFAPRDHDFPRRPDTIPRHKSRKARIAICAAGCLIQCFDRISANGLERLVTLWGEVTARARSITRRGAARHATGRPRDRLTGPALIAPRSLCLDQQENPRSRLLTGGKAGFACHGGQP